MSRTPRDLNSLNILQGDWYSVSIMQQLNHWDCLPNSLLMRCIPCTLLDHDTHDPLLGILKQSLLLAINTFQYWVQLLVLIGLFTHVIPYMILMYCFWHVYAFWLPLVSQGNWVCFCSTLLLLPFRHFPGFIWLRPLVFQFDQWFLVIDLENTVAVLSCQKLTCSVSTCGDS